MKKLTVIFLVLITSNVNSIEVELPICIKERRSLAGITLTKIGEFGLWRKNRPNVRGHFHTGIDIKRPNHNYDNEPIFPIAEGLVISKRDDGPYAQIIIEHTSENVKYWSVYEHVAGILVNLNDRVEIGYPIARFMNRMELDEYGWQFDHLHCEILKVKPMKLRGDAKNIDRRYNSYSLVCYTKDELRKYFYNPILFFENQFQN